MADSLKGKKGLTKEQLRREFCIQAKICSGKARDRKGAEIMCAHVGKEAKK